MAVSFQAPLMSIKRIVHAKSSLSQKPFYPATVLHSLVPRLFYSALDRVRRCFHMGVRVTGSCPTPGPRDPGMHRPHASRPGLEFLLAAHVPVNACAVPRGHGRTSHRPEDAPYRLLGPDLPCEPPLVARVIEVLKSMTEELRGFRAPHKWGVPHC